MAESILKIHTQNGDVPVGYPGLADKPISDKTLSKEGAFADSKAVGDKFKEAKTETDSLKEDLSNLFSEPYIPVSDRTTVDIVNGNDVFSNVSLKSGNVCCVIRLHRNNISL